MARIAPFLSYLFTGTAVVLGLSTTRCGAQFSEVGIKFGPSLTTLRSSLETDHSIVSMVLGTYAPVKINQRLFFQPEFEVALMGADREIDNEHTVQLRTLYARLPLTLRYRVAGGLQMGVGLQAGYLLMARQLHDEGISDVTDAMKPLDLSLIGGASVLIGRSTDLSLRYIYGMSSILRDDMFIYPTNRAVQFTIGVRVIRMKGKSGWRRRNIASKG
jgi:hypothetical protein